VVTAVVHSGHPLVGASRAGSRTGWGRLSGRWLGMGGGPEVGGDPCPPGKRTALVCDPVEGGAVKRLEVERYVQRCTLVVASAPECVERLVEGNNSFDRFYAITIFPNLVASTPTMFETADLTKQQTCLPRRNNYSFSTNTWKSYLENHLI